MKNKLKKLNLILIIVGVICIFSTTVLAVNYNYKSKEDKTAEKSSTTENIAENSNTHKLTKETIQKLYDEGHKLKDIEDAERNSKVTGNEIEDILKNKTIQQNKSLNATQIQSVEANSENEAKNIQNKEEFEKKYKEENNITDEEVDLSEKNGITEILEVGYFKYLSKQYSVPFSEIMDIYAKDKDTVKLVKELEARK